MMLKGNCFNDFLVVVFLEEIILIICVLFRSFINTGFFKADIDGYGLSSFDLSENSFILLWINILKFNAVTLFSYSDGWLWVKLLLFSERVVCPYGLTISHSSRCFYYLYLERELSKYWECGQMVFFSIFFLCDRVPNTHHKNSFYN